jgi:hypothetical protein
MRQLNSTTPNGPRATLHQYGVLFNGTCDMNCTMSRDSWNTKTGALFHAHGLGQWDYLLEWQGDKFGGCAKGTVRLGSKTPHPPADPFLRYAFTDGINHPCAVAVRNDTRIWHSYSKRIFALLDVTGTYA